jgi:maltose alpha-D-glucosyltransferase / alpha-amylase
VSQYDWYLYPNCGFRPEIISEVMEKELPWFDNAIIYAIDIGVYKDGDGDGTGDFRGAIEKLDYLQELGINCIWLLPFYHSSERDNGYDVDDYYSINRKFGGFDDFMEFKREAEKRDMRIIIDLIVHHTSDTHPWFKLASHNKNSKYYHYYIWNSNPPAIPEDNIFKGKTWQYNSHNDEYYYHKFYDFQPDLNIKNPEVRKEIKEIIRFWLDFGVAGFRLDAATHLFDPFNEDGDNKAGKMMEEFHDLITTLKKDTFFLAEADVKPEKIMEYVGEGNRMNMLFNFLLNNSLFLALARGNAEPVVERLKSLPKFPENVHWANFVRNLDELDLEQLTKNEREEVYQVFAPDERMRAYGRGIRRRFAPMVAGNVKCMKMVYNLIFALPGNPVIIYGDEIGMGDNLVYPGRRGVRTPMQWNSDKNGGFSDADEEMIDIKPITEGIFSYHFINVEDLEKDPDSLLNAIKQFIHVRKDVSKMYAEKYKIIDLKNKEIFALNYADDLLIFINFSKNPISLNTTYDFTHYTPILEDSSYGLRNEDKVLNLKEFGYRWFKRDTE